MFSWCQVNQVSDYRLLGASSFIRFDLTEMKTVQWGEIWQTPKFNFLGNFDGDFSLDSL